MNEIEKLAGFLTVAVSYVAIFVLVWTGVHGAGRLSLARRLREHHAAGEWLRVAPGRCYLAGLASLLVGWILLALLHSLKLLALLLLLAWGRSVFRGLVAWILLHGRELREGLEGDPGSDAECFRSGWLALAQASATPVLGWIFLAMALLQSAGAESLRSAGKRAPSHLLQPHQVSEEVGPSEPAPSEERE